MARSRRPWRIWVPVAAAAVLVLAAIAAWQWSSQPRYMWWVMDVAEPAGIAMVGGPPETGAMLNEGPIRTAEGSEVEVQLGQELRFRLLGDGADRSARGAAPLAAPRGRGHRS